MWVLIIVALSGVMATALTLIATLKTQNEHLTTIKRLKGELDTLMASFTAATRSSISSIRFTARVPTDGWTKTTFKLGLGNCGKVVKLLRFKEESDRFIITQVCEDNERKEFIYFKADVDGRIEIAHNGS